MSKAAQSRARLIDQRARRRATQVLIERHDEEFRGLYEQYRAEAETEMEALEIVAREQSDGHTPAHPPRLLPGRRKPRETVLDRLDVARCPDCIAYHDRGHACPRCGMTADVVSKLSEIHRLAAAGTRDDVIAVHLRIPPDIVRRVLNRAPALPAEGIAP